MLTAVLYLEVRICLGLGARRVAVKAYTAPSTPVIEGMHSAKMFSATAESFPIGFAMHPQRFPRGKPRQPTSSSAPACIFQLCFLNNHLLLRESDLYSVRPVCHFATNGRTT